MRKNQPKNYNSTILSKIYTIKKLKNIFNNIYVAHSGI